MCYKNRKLLLWICFQYVFLRYFYTLFLFNHRSSYLLIFQCLLFLSGFDDDCAFTLHCCYAKINQYSRSRGTEGKFEFHISFIISFNTAKIEIVLLCRFWTTWLVFIFAILRWQTVYTRQSCTQLPARWCGISHDGCVHN